MNPDTSLLSMTADSTQPENMTNVLSGTTAVIKPGGLSAESLFNIRSEKVITPKAEVATILKPTPPSLSKEEGSSQPTPSTAAKDSPGPINTPPVIPQPQFQMNKAPVPPGMDVRLPYNAHLAALMRQYEMINHNSKFKPVAIGNEIDSDASKRRQKETVPSPVPQNGVLKTVGSMQQVLQMPCRNVVPPVGLPLNDANLLNFGLPMPGFGWPILPFGNPFAPNFMQCFFPPQLPLLQNPLVFPQPSHTPLPHQSTQPVPNGNSQSKKRKAPTDTTTTKTQIKRAKEIGTETAD